MKGYLASLVAVAYLSWLCAFCLDCYWYGGVGVHGSAIQRRKEWQPPFPGKEMRNIFWFIQVSDIHLSVHYDPRRLSDFQTFVDTVLNTVRPSLVLVTGDITDAKKKNQVTAAQYEDEWKSYKSILNSSSLLQSRKIAWIDLRGNHDAFDVVSQDQDFFRRYGVAGGRYTPVFLWKHRLPYGQYSFLSIDASPSPGPKRPYNFFGVLDDNELSEIEKTVSQTQGDNLTLILTHYPSSVITTDHPRLRKILRCSVAHLCGHLHTLGGYAQKMYGHHPDGHLELELGDWKYSRKFRLLAVDHDILSFVDTSLHKWPLVLITNPVDAEFKVPEREPLGRILHSTHIRILVFSTSIISHVSVSIDSGNFVNATLSEGCLYTLPWNPAHYSMGLHSISVFVKDSSGSIQTVQQSFALDDTHVFHRKLPQFILLSDFRSLIRLTYFFVWFILLICLLVPWSKRAHGCFSGFTENKKIFLPLLIFLVYNGVGPLYMGELIQGTYGFVWTHGVYVSGHFIPGSMTYMHSTIELCFFVTPLTVYLRILTSRSNGCIKIGHVMMGVAIICELWGYHRAIMSYGVYTVIISPGYSWGMVLAAVLIFTAFRKRKR